MSLRVMRLMKTNDGWEEDNKIKTSSEASYLGTPKEKFDTLIKLIDDLNDH